MEEYLARIKKALSTMTPEAQSEAVKFIEEMALRCPAPPLLRLVSSARQ